MMRIRNAALAAALLVLTGTQATTMSQRASAYTASVSVDANQGLATFPSGLGIATAVYDGHMTDAAVPGLLASAGVKVVRYPGGSYADIFHWATTSLTNNGGYIATNDTFDNFMNDVVKPAGASAMITVNYGSNAAGTNGGDPTEAAAWVNYANNVKHYGIKYWEIGNEQQGNGYAPYGSAWEEDLYSDKSPGFYGRTALTFIKDMKAQDSTIQCGVGIVAPGTWPDNSSVPYNQNVLQACGSAIDFVIIHWYPTGTGTALINNTASIASLVSAVRAQLNKYCGSNASHIQICVTETGPGSFVSGQGAPFSLFATDDFLTWFQNGAPVVDWQELHAGYLDGNNTPEGPWYGQKMASIFGSPGDTILGDASNNGTLVSHAVKKANGSVSVILLNKDQNNAATVSVSIANVSLGATGTRYDFGQANFGNSSIYPTSGISQYGVSGVGTSFTVTVPAMTESIINIPAGSGGGGGNLVANGTYSLICRNGGEALDVPGWSTAQGVQLDQWASSGNSNQKFQLTNLGNNVVSLVNVNSNKAVEVYGFSKANGASVDQWPYWGGVGQQWRVTSAGGGYYTLTNVNSGQNLDVSGASTANGALIDQWPSNGGANQQWSFH